MARKMACGVSTIVGETYEGEGTIVLPDIFLEGDPAKQRLQTAGNWEWIRLRWDRFDMSQFPVQATKTTAQLAFVNSAFFREVLSMTKGASVRETPV